MLEYKPNFGGAAAILQAAAEVIAQAEFERLQRLSITPLTDEDARRIHSIPFVRDCLLRYVERPTDHTANAVVRSIVNAINGLPVGSSSPPSHLGDTPEQQEQKR